MSSTYRTLATDLRRTSRWFGWYNWKSELRNSELPAEIRQVIADVVWRTGLYGWESRSVVRELIAHFQDGLNRDHSHQQLIEDFGDPVLAAALIRRSKIRNRPMFMKLVRGIAIGVGILAAAYAGLSMYFYLGKPTPNVDYVAFLNRNLDDVEDHDQAWPIYRPLWAKYGFSEGGGLNLEELHYRNEDDEHDGRLIQPGDPGWPAAVEVLQKYEDLLDVFRRGAQQPYLGIKLQADPKNYSDEDFAAIFPGAAKSEIDSSLNFESMLDDPELARLMEGSTIGVLLPHVQVLRKAARMFVVDTRLAVSQGDSTRALENLQTIFGLAHHAAEGNLLVCTLVSYAVAGMGFDQLEEVVEEHPEFFSEDQLAEIQRTVENISMRDWMRVEGERLMLHDMIQRIYTDDGKGDGRLTPQGVKIVSELSRWWTIYPDNESLGFEEVIKATRNVVAPASLIVSASRKQMADKGDELIDRFVEDLDRPYWEAENPDFEEWLADNEVKYHLLSVLFPAVTQVRNAMDRLTGRQDGVIAAVAIHRYFRKYGQWPAEYSDVSPEFVQEFPLDQVNGALLRFTFQDNQLIVYSVGNDRDDDGGADRVFGSHVEPREHFIFGRHRDVPDGDWIVWPQREDR